MSTQNHVRIASMMGIGALALGLGACGEQQAGTATTTEVVTQTAPASQSAEQSTSGEPTSSDAKASASTGGDSSSEESTSDKPAPSESGSSKPSDKPEGAPSCSTEQLTLSIDKGDSAAGHVKHVLTFTNKGQACEMSGFADVVAVGGGNGRQIGEFSARTGDPGKWPVIVAANGGRATMDIEMTNIGTTGGPLGDDCKPVPADGLRVYPPESEKAMYVAVKGLTACSTKVKWMSHGRVSKA